MGLSLEKVTIEESETIYNMQKLGFQALLEQYQDFETNPGAETLERIEKRFQNLKIDHYFIRLQNVRIGYIRIHRIDEKTCRLSQMFVLPQYQNKGYAQQAIEKAEQLNPQAKRWILDTIKQEKKLCHLYEKMGYRLTGTEMNIKEGMDLVDYAK